MRKHIAILLIGVLFSVGVVGCASKDVATTNTNQSTTNSGKTAEELLVEKYEEPVKVKVVLGYRDPENPDTPDSVTPETQTAVKLLKEELNIELEYSWIVNSDQYSQKFGAELAAGNLPDIMMLSMEQFEDLQSQGGLGDLTEAYEQYRTDDIDAIINYDGQVLDTCRKDGKLYGLYNGTYQGQVTSQIYYDMNKLKELGIEEVSDLPTTIAEFEALCDKLMALDLDGNGKVGDPVLPAAKGMNSGLADFGAFFQAYETALGGWYDDGNGNLISSHTQENMKKALTKLNEWYDKGYFAKDFAAQDVYAANAPIVSDIVAGKYSIIPGSWWIPNWPLNDNKKNDPDADWVVGPTLTVDGTAPTILVPRISSGTIVAVSKDFKNPEAIFKMMNWSLNYEAKIANPEYKENMTPEQKLEADSYVYTWLPYRVYAPMSLIDNYNFISEADKAGKTEITAEEAPANSEFWGAWNAYLQMKNGSTDPVVWGLYTSRVSPNGGVAQMYELYSKSEKWINEVYVTTPTMIKKQGELDKYETTTFLSMVMGETPISDFDKFVAQWEQLGGSEIQAEVNEWYKNK